MGSYRPVTARRRWSARDPLQSLDALLCQRLVLNGKRTPVKATQLMTGAPRYSRKSGALVPGTAHGFAMTTVTVRPPTPVRQKQYFVSASPKLFARKVERVSPQQQMQGWLLRLQCFNDCKRAFRRIVLLLSVRIE